MAKIALNVFALDRGGVQGLADRLLSGSSLVRASSPSPFENFGVLAAGPILARNRSVEETRFSVTVARARIVEFSEGTFRPGMLQELINYLAERFLRLDAKTFADGRTVNYLTDMVTGESVLASNVDRRLSRGGIARLFGRTLDAEAEAMRRRMEMTPEMVDAQALRSANATRFRNDPREIPFADWGDLQFSASSVFDNREMTGQGNELWVGFEVAKASDSVEENLAMLRRLRDKGHKVIVPAKTVEDAKAGRLVAGMPILLREGAVRTRLINQRFTAEKFAAAFGSSIFAHYEDLARRAPGAERPKDKVVRMADFKQFRRRPVEAEPVERKSVSAAQEGRFSVRHEMGEGGRETLTVIDAAGGETPLHRTDLAAGRYAKEDAFGLVNGYLVVRPDGGYAHEDLAGRHHNPFGPAIVPAEGSGERPSFALDGEFLSMRDFRSRSETGSARDLLRRDADQRRDREEADRREREALANPEGPRRLGA